MLKRLLFPTFIFLLGGALTMTGDRLYKKWNRVRFHKTADASPPLDTRSKVLASQTSPDLAHDIYQLMHITHEVFDALHITYWADGGTLLGAVRNAGLILTDDDVDLAILHKDEPKLMNEVKRHLEARGCTIITVEPCYKICFIKDLKVNPQSKGEADRYLEPTTGVDIFPMQEATPGIYTYSNAHADALWSGTNFYHKRHVFPLQKKPFGPLMIFVPYDPYPHLDLSYPGWNTHAYISNYHKPGNPIEPFTVPLTPELRKPAPWRAGFEYIPGQKAPMPPKVDIARDFPHEPQPQG